MEQDLPNSNPMERGYSLPPGCKELIDALKGRQAEPGCLCVTEVLPTNEKITAEYVRVFWPNKTEIGVFEVKDAIAMAKSLQMDLVETGPKANPPICFLIDTAAIRRALSKRRNK